MGIFFWTVYGGSFIDPLRWFSFWTVYEGTFLVLLWWFVSSTAYGGSCVGPSMVVLACPSMMVVFRTVDGRSFFGASKEVLSMSFYGSNFLDPLRWFRFWSVYGGSFIGPSMEVRFWT